MADRSERNLRWLAIAGLLVALLVCVWPAPSPGTTGWRTAVASAYSAASSSTRQGCPRAPALRDSARSVATFLVPCGARLQVCHRSRCVTVTRHDSGPFIRGRTIDLNVGVVRALGYPTARAWGVRTVTWRRA